jgi:hypothetical protein
MKYWEISACWVMYGTTQIEAETEEEAREKAYNNRFDFDWDEEYEAGSFEIDSLVELESDLDVSCESCKYPCSIPENERDHACMNWRA